MSDNQPISVTELNQNARRLLEVNFSQVRVTGEISNLARPNSGHIYFSLKDPSAQVRCAMFRGRASRLTFQPREGDQIVVRGKLSLYEPRGDYQLIVDNMMPAGDGLLKIAFEELKAKLQAEGLFDPAYKKPLPDQINRVAVVTSQTGAAIRDILTVLKRRSPGIEVDIYPTLVQGQEAAGQIADAITRANRDNRVDTIIVGRGGGSLEDLWPFNEEIVARAVFQSQIPVVSAVGHEVDFTISDMVADVRAPTPSAAAELVSNDQDAILNYLSQLQDYFFNWINNKIAQQQQLLLHVSKRLQRPDHKLQQQAQTLDHLESRLITAMESRLERLERKFEHIKLRFEIQSPEQGINLIGHQVLELYRRLQQSIEHSLEVQQQKLQLKASVLNTLSPLQTLARGYSLTTNENGNVVTDKDQVQKGERIITQLSVGQLTCEVIETQS